MHMLENREFNWDDEIIEESGEYVLLEEGDYEYTVTKVERTRSEGSKKLPPCNMTKVTFRIGENNITENFILHSSLEWKLSQLFLSVGMKKHGEPLKMNWTAIQGKKGNCHVVIEKYTKKDGRDATVNHIKKFYAYDEDITVVPNNAQPKSITSEWTPGTF